MPIGIQDFEKLRRSGCVYVDKTAFVHSLTKVPRPYFLGRPRRFGKSLFISTLKAYFLGKRELFDGSIGQRLAIADLEKDWIEYPVLHIDLSLGSYSDLKSLERGLDTNLRRMEKLWGEEPREQDPASRFAGLINRACEKSGNKVAVLIDEYDRPLTQTLEAGLDQTEILSALKGFYGVLKGSDEYLRFLLLTGVTKFSRISVFSDLNQPQDISMNEDYANICGITESELTANFEPELKILAAKNEMSYEEALAEMQKRYNGYHFAKNSEGVYNPFSVLNTFSSKDFSYYWFKTGTPTLLVDAIKKNTFDPLNFARGIKISASEIDNYRPGGANLTPLLYQSGYLTVKAYDKKNSVYTLGFPNEEVEYGFLDELLPLYIPQPEDFQGFSILKFYSDIWSGDTEAFMKRLTALFSGIPYELNDKSERHYQAVFYLIFRLLGQYVQAEVRSAAGRAVAVVYTKDRVYVFEFKLAENGTAESALKQIDEKAYLIPYTVSGKKLIKVGVAFDCLRRVHTPAPWGETKGMYPESNTLPEQPYPDRSAAGLVDSSTRTIGRWLAEEM
jgi:hypothetical protein